MKKMMTYSDMIADLRVSRFLRKTTTDVGEVLVPPLLWSRIVDVLEAAMEKHENLAVFPEPTKEPFATLFTTWQGLQGEIQP